MEQLRFKKLSDEDAKKLQRNKVEMKKCKDSPLYFYNTYCRHDDDPILNQEEFDARAKLIMAERNKINNISDSVYATFPMTDVLTKDEQDGLDYVDSIDDAIKKILREHSGDGHIDGYEQITAYILDNYCPKADGDREARYVLPGSLIIPPDKVEALKEMHETLKNYFNRFDVIGVYDGHYAASMRKSFDKLNLEEILKR